MKQIVFFSLFTVTIVTSAMDNSTQKTHAQWLREYKELQLTLCLAQSDTFLLQVNIATLERMITHAPCFKDTPAMGWSAFKPRAPHKESLTGFMAQRKLDLQQWAQANGVTSISQGIHIYLLAYFTERQLWATNLYETNRAIRTKYAKHFSQNTEGLQRIKDCFNQRMAKIAASQQLMEKLVQK